MISRLKSAVCSKAGRGALACALPGKPGARIYPGSAGLRTSGYIR